MIRNKVVEDAGLKVSNDEIVDHPRQNHGPVQHANMPDECANRCANTPTLPEAGERQKLRERVRGHSGRESAGKPARGKVVTDKAVTAEEFRTLHS
jgi:trigger factor